MKSNQSSYSSLSRRGLLGSAAASLSLGAFGCNGSDAQRPNIVWIIAEDFSPDLSCYGNEALSTPHIDRLAAEGVRFTNAFMTAPVCSAARSALVLGMHQGATGGHHHPSHQDGGYRPPAHMLPFTHYLRGEGYHSSNLKNSHSLQGTGKTHFNFEIDNVYDGEDWSERRPEQPFYAQINFSETHRAFRWHPGRPVDPAKMQIPPCYPDVPPIREDWRAYLETAHHLDDKVGRVLTRLDEEGLTDDTIVFFFGDHGRPMPRAKQFLYDGGIHIPLIARIPERFHVEGYQAGAVREDLISSIDITATTIQLAGATVPDYMHGRPFFGPNIRKRDYVVCARDRCDATTDRIRCVRDKKFKYIKNYFPDIPYTQRNRYKDLAYPPLRVMRDMKEAGTLTGPPALFMADKRPPQEFYDLEADPHEINNLAGKPEHEGQITKMRGILDQWIKETGDMGQQDEANPPAAPTQAQHWYSFWGTVLSTNSAGLHVDCKRERRGMQFSRSVVVEGGELVVQFRARSKDVGVESVYFGLIGQMRNPDTKAGTNFKADGKWHEAESIYNANGWLGMLSFLLSGEKGTIEFDWIRIGRKEDGKVKKLQEWKFA